MTSIMTAGRISSTWPMSFENRFKIRPEGFVWKKYMRARVTPWNIMLCKFLDALMANCGAKKMGELNLVAHLAHWVVNDPEMYSH